MLFSTTLHNIRLYQENITMVVDLELTNFSYTIGNGCIGRCHSNLHQIQTLVIR